MTAPVLIRSYAVDRRRGGATCYEDHHGHASPSRAAHAIPNSVERNSAFFMPGASHFDGNAAGGIGSTPNDPRRNPKSSRFEFMPALMASGSHIPRKPRIHLRQQSSSGLSERFHHVSFPDARELQSQFTTGESANVRESVGEIQNV